MHYNYFVASNVILEVLSSFKTPVRDCEQVFFYQLFYLNLFLDN